jgi:hypothetical protein
MRHGPSVTRTVRFALVLILASVSLSVPAATPALAATPDPLAHWAMDAGSGTSVTDGVGDLDARIDGDVTWATPGYGGSGSALDFDGGWFDIENAPLLEPSEASFAVWIRSDVAPSSRQVILEKGAFGCEGPSYGLYATEDGIELGLRSGSGAQSLWFGLSSDEAQVDLWDGRWHQAAFALSMDHGNGSLVLDGYRIAAHGQSGVVDIGYEGASDDRFRVGAPIDGTCEDRSPFIGQIDDMRLFESSRVALFPTDLFPSSPGTVEMAPLGGPWVTGSMHVLEAKVTPTPRFGHVQFRLIGEKKQYPFTYRGEDMGNGVFRVEMEAGDADDYVVTAFATGLGMDRAEDSSSVTVTPIASTTTLTVTPASPLPFGTYELTATVSSGWAGVGASPLGTVTFVRSPGANEVVLGTYTLQSVDATTSRAKVEIFDGSGAGGHTYAARYSGDGRRTASTGNLTVMVAKTPPSFYLDGPTTVQTNHSFVLAASAGAENLDAVTGATVTIRKVGSSTPLCAGPLATSGYLHCTVGSLPIGTHSFQATYSGNTNVAPSTSNVWKVVVTADIVDATSVTRDLSTFYPVKDGYADVLRITGKRNEPLSVAVNIYNSAGTKVKTFTLSRAAGTYNLGWNGRNSSGTILSAGKYRIVQTLKDAFGTTKSFTSYVNLSKKRLVDKTTYVYRTVTSPSAKGDSGSGSITVSTAGGYVKLVGSYPNGWVGVGYQFTLPSAPVYRSIAFQVYSKSVSGVPPNTIKMHNFRKADCGYTATTSGWREACFDRVKSIGNTGSTAWYSTTGSTTYNRHERVVRGMVAVQHGTVYLYKVRVRVVYAVLQ